MSHWKLPCGDAANVCTMIACWVMAVSGGSTLRLVRFEHELKADHDEAYQEARKRRWDEAHRYSHCDDPRPNPRSRAIAHPSRSSTGPNCSPFDSGAERKRTERPAAERPPSETVMRGRSSGATARARAAVTSQSETPLPPQRGAPSPTRCIVPITIVTTPRKRMSAVQPS